MQLPFATDDAGTIRTAISPSYVPRWGIVECLREVLQEALDLMAQGYKVTVGSRSGSAIVADLGPGLKREHLALGRSSKKDQPDLIGNFGEGIKLAALVAARLGRWMRIESVEFSAEPFICLDPALQCEVLAFRVGPSERRQGTKIAVQASKDELDRAKSLFLHFREGRRVGDERVFLPGGRFYVNGALAGESDRWLFSYNVTGEQTAKQAQNRDRTVVDEDFVQRHAAKAIQQTRSRGIIETLIQAHIRNESYLETDLYLSTSGKAWSRAAAGIVGSKAKTVLSYNPRADLEAQNHGFKVVTRWGAWRYLLRDLGYRQSIDVASGLRAKKMVPARLSPKETALLKAAIAAIKQAYGDPGKVRVTDLEDLMLDGSSVRPALYNPKMDTIWLSKRLFGDPYNLFETLLHETVHRQSGAPDASREFETALCHLAAQVIADSYLHHKNGFWEAAHALVSRDDTDKEPGPRSCALRPDDSVPPI